MSIGSSNLLTLVTIIILITSCATQYQRRDLGVKEDSLADETLIRTVKSDANLKFSNDLISDCYKGFFKQGLKNIKKKFSSKPKNGQYWNSVGTCYLLQGKLSRAEYYYRLGVNDKSYQYDIKNNLAVIALKRKNYAQAVQLLEEIVSSSKLKVSRFNLASLYTFLGHHEKSNRLIDALLKFNANDPDFNFIKAKNLLADSKFQRSLYYFNKIPQEYQSDYDISNYMALALTYVGKLDEAESVLAEKRLDQEQYHLEFERKLRVLIDKKRKEQKQSNTPNNRLSKQNISNQNVSQKKGRQ